MKQVNLKQHLLIMKTRLQLKWTLFTIHQVQNNRNDFIQLSEVWTLSRSPSSSRAEEQMLGEAVWRSVWTGCMAKLGEWISEVQQLCGCLPCWKELTPDDVTVQWIRASNQACHLARESCIVGFECVDKQSIIYSWKSFDWTYEREWNCQLYLQDHNKRAV